MISVERTVIWSVDKGGGDQTVEASLRSLCGSLKSLVNPGVLCNFGPVADKVLESSTNCGSAEEICGA